MIPGIEVETIKGVHLLCYFNLLLVAESFGLWLESHLKRMKNNKESFGEQWMMNEKDELFEEYPFLLIQSTDLHCEEIVSKVH